jgi:hypothetical protein
MFDVLIGDVQTLVVNVLFMRSSSRGWTGGCGLIKASIMLPIADVAASLSSSYL